MAPRASTMGLGRYQFFRRLKRFAFHLQVDFDLAVGRFNGSVAQPGPDHVQVHIGLKQAHCRRVADGVWRDSSGEQ